MKKNMPSHRGALGSILVYFLLIWILCIIIFVVEAIGLTKSTNIFVRNGKCSFFNSTAARVFALQLPDILIGADNRIVVRRRDGLNLLQRQQTTTTSDLPRTAKNPRFIATGVFREFEIPIKLTPNAKYRSSKRAADQMSQQKRWE